MDTHGHERVAREVGEPILKKAFGEGLSLESFYLGNWLTDVSQMVDPVATEGMIAKVNGIVDDIAKKIFEFENKGPLGRFIHKRFDDQVKKSKEDLLRSLQLFAKKGNEKRNSELQDLIRLAFRINGYFKFCHPAEGNGAFRLDPEVYFKIFADRFTQYYPHEHMDRPEILGSSPKRFDYKRDNKSKNTEDSNPSNSLLYSYLKEDLLLIAGLLGEVDIYFSGVSKRPLPRNNDFVFHLTLSKLGHALHAIEDFFAHSNFLEHAFLSMDSAFLKENRITMSSGNDKVDSVFFNTLAIFDKRLKGLKDGLLPSSQDEKDWKKAPDEGYVSTGYFDGTDTFFSISAVFLELFGLDKSDPVEDYLKTKNYIKSKRWMKDAMELLTDHEKSLKDKDNLLAQQCEKEIKDFKKKYESKINIEKANVREEVIDLMFSKQPGLFRGNQKIETDIRIFFRLMSDPPKALQLTSDALSYYKIFKDISLFFNSPRDWLFDGIKDRIKEKIKDTTIFYAEKLAYNLLGRYRLGSHSLMAKDHHNDELFTHMFNCAGAIHYTVIDNITRWFSKSWQINSRTDKPVWINWIELIEFYLRHPGSEFDDSKGEEELFVYNLLYKVKNNGDQSDTLKSLADHFRGDSYYANAPDPESLESSYPYWKAIADANWRITETLEKFNISNPVHKEEAFKQLINQILKEQKTGNLITSGWAKGNYALKNNTEIIIPLLVNKRKIKQLKKLKEKWFYDVLKTRSWKIFKAENSNLANQYFRNKYHTLKEYSIKNKRDLVTIPKALSDLLKAAKFKRVQLEEAYVIK